MDSIYYSSNYFEIELNCWEWFFFLMRELYDRALFWEFKWPLKKNYQSISHIFEQCYLNSVPYIMGQYTRVTWLSCTMYRIFKHVICVREKLVGTNPFEYLLCWNHGAVKRALPLYDARYGVFIVHPVRQVTSDMSVSFPYKIQSDPFAVNI